MPNGNLTNNWQVCVDHTIYDHFATTNIGSNIGNTFGNTFGNTLGDTLGSIGPP